MQWGKAVSSINDIRKLNTYMQKNQTGLLSHSIYKKNSVRLERWRPAKKAPAHPPPLPALPPALKAKAKEYPEIQP